MDGRGAPQSAATRWRHASGKWARPLGPATSLAPRSCRTPGRPIAISGSAWPAAAEPYARAGAALRGRRSCACVPSSPHPDLAPALPCLLFLGDLRPRAITEWETRDHPLPSGRPETTFLWINLCRSVDICLRTRSQAQRAGAACSAEPFRCCRPVYRRLHPLRAAETAPSVLWTPTKWPLTCAVSSHNG